MEKLALTRLIGLIRPLAVAVFLVIVVGAAVCFSQSQYEGRIIGKVSIQQSDQQPKTSKTGFEQLIEPLSGTRYSAAKIHDAIIALYATKKVASVSATATESGSLVDLVFIIRSKDIINRVLIDVTATGKGEKVTEQELLFKLNLLTPGTAITEQNLRNNADIILDYLRERGFRRSEVTFEEKVVPGLAEVDVLFHVKLGDQATVERFNIEIGGLTEPIPVQKLLLRPGKVYSRQRLQTDLDLIRSILRKGDFVAPELSEPRVTYNPATNSVIIDLVGSKGPTVDIVLDVEKDKAGSGTLNRLLPVKKEGTLDFAAIVEGERRLESYYQEQGYFFVNATPLCSVDPPLADGDRSTLPNGTEFVCSALSSADLIDHKVEVKYHIDLSRKLRLKTIRIKGTDKLTYEDVSTVLDSQKANILGVIPIFGYGRGVTSADTLEEDAATIRSLMNELGYRDAVVRVNRGVSPNSDDLIITFVVEEGPPTIVDGVKITGNAAFPTDILDQQIPPIAGRNYSRARIRNAVRKLQAFYADRGYYDARVTSSLTEPVANADATEKRVTVELKVENEGKPVVIERVLITGTTDVKDSAVQRAIFLEPGNLLKAADVYASEQSLFSSDAFDSVNIKLQPAGNAPTGERKTDVIINLNEQAPRLLNYGAGYSTDLGLNGFFDIRHVNLLGNLWQGGARVRMSRNQQLIQFDFINPRFMREARGRFAPLTISAQYQRDATITRFFRSAFDKGTFGIVQRLDDNGNAVDEFGVKTGRPTLNRLTFTVETSRTLSTKSRSIIFAKFKFEDARLLNINSLLVRDLLKPDSRIRTSGLSFTYVRDTRQNCQIKYSLLETIAKGEPADKCRYNASDPTNGYYITAQYDVSVPQLGANIGFHKFQANYKFYYSIRQLNRTTFAAQAIVGLAHVYSNGNRFPAAQFPGLDGILPISERFFGGGSTTLRGFDFEEAGPRAVIVPQGTFRNSQGNQVFLDPFTLPFGGNALAIVNLEARIPLTKALRAVPFYDGGNVFRKVGDIFNPPNTLGNTAFQTNLRALWTSTVGLGFRLKTPIGGEFGVDYGYLLNPPQFRIPQVNGPDAIYRLRQGQIHFRFSQAF